MHKLDFTNRRCVQDDRHREGCEKVWMRKGRGREEASEGDLFLEGCEREDSFRVVLR